MMAEEKQPHDAIRIRCLDHVAGFNEQGIIRGRWLLRLVFTTVAVAAEDEEEASSTGWGWDWH